jgi:predicted kinase
MYIKELANGIYVSDSVAGTVTRVGYTGAYVLLDAVEEDGAQFEAFVKARLKKGQRVLLKVTHYNKKRRNFFCELDSTLGAPQPERVAEAPVEQLEQAVERIEAA